MTTTVVAPTSIDVKFHSDLLQFFALNSDALLTLAAAQKFSSLVPLFVTGRERWVSPDGKQPWDHPFLIAGDNRDIECGIALARSGIVSTYGSPSFFLDVAEKVDAELLEFDNLDSDDIAEIQTRFDKGMLPNYLKHLKVCHQEANRAGTFFVLLFLVRNGCPARLEAFKRFDKSTIMRHRAQLLTTLASSKQWLPFAITEIGEYCDSISLTKELSEL